MNRIWLVFIAVSLLLLLMGSQAMALPKMFLPEDSFDFGFSPRIPKFHMSFG